MIRSAQGLIGHWREEKASSDPCTAVRRAMQPWYRCISEDANGAFDHSWSNCTLIGRPVRLLLVV